MSLCIILVSYGSAAFIKNSGETAKMTRFVFAVTLLCSLLSGLPSISFIDIPFSMSSQDYTNYNLSEAAFTGTVEQMLKKEETEFKKVSISYSQNEDGSINIEKIRVTGAKEPEKVKKIISENTGIEQIEVS